MTDQSGRVLPTSRQPVTPEDPTSATLAPQAGSQTAGSDEADESNRVGGTSAMSPSTSSAASANASSATRTADLADAERESVRLTDSPVSPDFGGGAEVGPDVDAGVGSGGASGYSSGSGSGYGSGYGSGVGSGMGTGSLGSEAPTQPGGTLSATRTTSGDSELSVSGTSGTSVTESSMSGTSFTGTSGTDLGSGTSAAGVATVGTGGASILRSPTAQEKVTERAKELVARGKVAGAQAQQNPKVAQALQTAQSHPLVLRAKDLIAQRNASPGSRRAPVPAFEPRPEAPPLPERTGAPRDPEKIESDISATRTHLAWAVDEINFRIKPATIQARGKAKAQEQVMQPDGSVRTERVGPAVGGLVALLLLRLWRGRRRRKKAARRARARARAGY